MYEFSTQVQDAEHFHLIPSMSAPNWVRFGQDETWWGGWEAEDEGDPNGSQRCRPAVSSVEPTSRPGVTGDPEILRTGGWGFPPQPKAEIVSCSAVKH